MFCEQCGAEMPDNSKFCENCGVKMEELSATGSPRAPGASGTAATQAAKQSREGFPAQTQGVPPGAARAETTVGTGAKPYQSVTPGQRGVQAVSPFERRGWSVAELVGLSFCLVGLICTFLPWQRVAEDSFKNGLQLPEAYVFFVPCIAMLVIYPIFFLIGEGRYHKARDHWRWISFGAITLLGWVAYMMFIQMRLISLGVREEWSSYFMGLGSLLLLVPLLGLIVITIVVFIQVLLKRRRQKRLYGAGYSGAKSAGKAELGQQGVAAGTAQEAGPGDKQKTRRSRKALGISIAAAGTAAVVAAVAIILVFFVFKGGGPDDTVAAFFEAVGARDINAVMETIDPEAESKQLDAFEDWVLEDVPSGGVSFSGMEYSSEVVEDKGTVKIESGSLTFAEDGKEKTEKLSDAGYNTSFEMVRRDGKWYIGLSSFPIVNAAKQLEEAESAWKSWKNSEKQCEKELNELMERASVPGETASSKNVCETCEAVSNEAKAVKEMYEEILEIKGAAEYAEYAEAMVKVAEKSSELYEYSSRVVDDIVSSLMSGDPGGVVGYMEKLAELTEEVEDAEERAEAIKKAKGL